LVWRIRIAAWNLIVREFLGSGILLASAATAHLVSQERDHGDQENGAYQQWRSEH
jgi:hypothetical protein